MLQNHCTVTCTVHVELYKNCVKWKKTQVVSTNQHWLVLHTITLSCLSLLDIYTLPNPVIQQRKEKQGRREQGIMWKKVPDGKPFCMRRGDFFTLCFFSMCVSQLLSCMFVVRCVLSTSEPSRAVGIMLFTEGGWFKTNCSHIQGSNTCSESLYFYPLNKNTTISTLCVGIIRLYRISYHFVDNRNSKVAKTVLGVEYLPLIPTLSVSQLHKPKMPIR